jgi:hypothetical protein
VNEECSNALDRWYAEPMDLLPFVEVLGGGRSLAEYMGQVHTLQCRYLTAPLEDVAARVSAGLVGEASKAELRRLVDSATLCRASIRYTLRRPPKKVIPVCRGYEVLPAEGQVQLTVNPRVPYRQLLQRHVWDLVQEMRPQSGRQFGPEKRAHLMQVAEVYQAAAPRGRSSAVARAFGLPDDADGHNAARQRVRQARDAGYIEPVAKRSRRRGAAAAGRRRRTTYPPRLKRLLISRAWPEGSTYQALPLDWTRSPCLVREADHRSGRPDLKTTAAARRRDRGLQIARPCCARPRRSSRRRA